MVEPTNENTIYKNQILTLFDYLVQNYTKETLNKDAAGACSTAITLLANQKIQINLFVKLTEHLMKESQELKLNRKKMIELVKELHNISPK